MEARFNQLPIWPCWRVKGTGKTYGSLQEAALSVKELTVNNSHRLIRRPDPEKESAYREYAGRIIDGAFSRTTVFNEIEVVLKHVPAGIRSLYGKVPGEKKIEVGYLAEMGVQALTAAIEAQWTPGKIHIMPHSSGYDSRLISAILMRLADKNGIEWLGEMRFVCWEPEIRYFRRLMHHMGWPEHFICPVKEGAGPVDYYGEVIDFDLIGALYSENERLWAGPALGRKWMQAQGLDEDQCEGISALFGDETMKWHRLRWGNVAYLLACYLFENPSPWTGSRIPFMAPFVSEPWLALITRYRIGCSVDDFKLAMIHMVDPDLVNLDRFPNFRFVAGPVLSQHRYQPFQVLGDETVKNARERFAQAGGGRPQDLFKDNVLRYFDPVNQAYVRLAIFNNLKKKGCEIHE